MTYPAYTLSGAEVYDPSMGIQLVIQSKQGRDMRKYNPADWHRVRAIGADGSDPAGFDFL